MAITFKQLKSPLLAPTDQIPVGKFKGCRVCDVIEDNYEYLIWADKQGLLKYSAIVMESILEIANFEKQKSHYTEEIEPYLDENPFTKELKEIDGRLEFLSDDDIPF